VLVIVVTKEGGWVGVVWLLLVVVVVVVLLMIMIMVKIMAPVMHHVALTRRW
jgi:hypothetical protein